jgi:5-hydroxyisourate hydrolase
MTISTHVLDTSIGRPAAGVEIRLEYEAIAGAWRPVTRAVTDEDGRAPALLHTMVVAGTYRLTFETGTYFSGRQVDSFYPRVSVDFVIRDPALHYHVPLLVTPYGYSTYRGS